MNINNRHKASELNPGRPLTIEYLKMVFFVTDNASDTCVPYKPYLNKTKSIKCKHQVTTQCFTFSSIY